MRSPFPGMDPYLERRWGDFHTTFMTYLRDVINPSLPGSLRARVEERVLVESNEAPPRSYRPDAHVFHRPDADDAAGGTATLAEPVAEPVVISETLEDGLTQRSLVIIDAASGGKAISAIELLSPTNKQPGFGQQEYLRKQAAYVEAGVNLLELDLLVGGASTTLAARAGIPEKHRTLYHASLKNARLGGRIELYPITLRQPLPRLAFPLREQDQPIVLSLQPVFDTTYERGYYAQDTHYETPIDALPEAERPWLLERISQWRTTRVEAPAAGME